MKGPWRQSVGKGLELVGLICVGMALVMGVSQNDMGLELKALAVGAVIFCCGWLLEGGSDGGG